jgi:hypothetical protein
MSADVIRLRKARKPSAPDITDLLPFVKIVQKGRRREMDHWAVKPTGDMVQIPRSARTTVFRFSTTSSRRLGT